jgi:hypothetical protein
MSLLRNSPKRLFFVPALAAKKEARVLPLKA